MPTTINAKIIQAIKDMNLGKEITDEYIGKLTKAAKDGNKRLCRTLVDKIHKLYKKKMTDDYPELFTSDTPPPSGIYNKKTRPPFETACIEYLLGLADYLDKIPDLVDYYIGTENMWKWLPKTLKDENDDGGISKFFEKPEDDGAVETLVKNKTIMISADCQSGKSTLIIARAIKSLLLGFTPIICVRNLTADVKQIVNNLTQRVDEMMEAVRLKGIKATYNIKILENLGGVRNRDALTKFLTKEEYGIVVVLTNPTQLGHVIEATEEYHNKYDLFIDEIDFVNYGKNSSGELCDTAQQLCVLKEHSHQTFAITATPLDAFFNDSELKASNHFRMPFPSDYRGFPDVEIIELDKELEYKGLGADTTFNDYIRADANLLNFFRRIGKPYSPRVAGCGRANVSLLKITSFTDAQINLGNGFHNLYPKTPVIVYNGGGVKMNYDGMVPVEINGQQVVPDEFANITIQQALQYLKDHRLFVFSDILIIAGLLASRGISFTSSDYEWHLNDMYYIPSSSATIPEMIQSVGRLCGRNRGKGPLHLHTTKKIAEQIYNGYNFTDELIAEAMIQPVIEAEKQKEEQSLADKMLTIDMEKKKFPVGRKITNKTKVNKGDFNLKNHTVVGRRSMEEYKYKKAKVEEPEDEELKPIDVLKKMIQHHDDGIWRNHNTWYDLTGDCGYQDKSNHHKAMTQTLVNQHFIEKRKISNYFEFRMKK